MEMQGVDGGIIPPFNTRLTRANAAGIVALARYYISSMSSARPRVLDS